MLKFFRPKRYPMNSRHNLWLRIFLPLLLPILYTNQAFSQNYPNKPIKLVVPFPAGGPTDIVARPYSLLMSEVLNQQVVIDNRGGAGGSIGADIVAKSKPDGYTLLMGTVGTNAINGSLYKNLAYDTIKDFTPIALVASAPIVILVNPSATNINSLKGLVNQAKEKPSSIPFGSAGNGTPGHLTGALFETSAQIKLKHIPYKGSAPAMNDLLGGQIPVMFDPIQTAISHIKSGKIIALAVTSKVRSPLLPNVPTVAELGYPEFESTAWWAVFGPANLPEDITKILRKDSEKVSSSAEYKTRLGNLGVLPNTNFSSSLANFQIKEIAKWAIAVRDSGATID